MINIAGVTDPRTLKDAWQQETATLREVEDRVSRAWTAFSNSQGPAPSPELMEELARARRNCDARLQALLTGLVDDGKAKDDGSGSR